ncbi:MAG: hypothetical protein Q9167_004143 [Letrouitia subvulpina]
MCLFKINPKNAPIQPPGAAPTLMTLEEDHKVTLMGEEQFQKSKLASTNQDSIGIASSLDISEKLEPVRPIIDAEAGPQMNGTMSLPAGAKAHKKPTKTVNPTSIGIAESIDIRQELLPNGGIKDEVPLESRTNG